MGDEAGAEFSAVADGIILAGDVQRLGEDKLDAAHGHIPTGGVLMGGDDDGLEAAFEFMPLIVHLVQEDGECDPLARADVFEGDIELQDPTDGF